MELLDVAAPFEFLLGTWKGAGKGRYPTIKDFTFEETLTFEAQPGKPFFVYQQRTFNAQGAPMHTEVGFLRFIGGDKVEFTLAQQTGQTELLEGTANPEHTEIAVQSTLVGNTSTAKTVSRTARTYRFNAARNTMHTEFDMEAVGQAMANHLVSDLQKVQ